ncbi:ABC transporter substrate-binding protein [Celeribacter indicus]|uniref:Oligopeptide ABC transporter oligopeptide-binding protein n=1 Tax=Celeribacter indicus TaxID=1208324 RepID=A0A0B5DXE1_9RHOB|nr:ABC transporter substrate-binding protein [Celeribacter indicus]AJE45760.1 oligopeptide ABC transporter oligopeptide-binding protein [Celeribacter indicus]SDX53334.1 peptide/nickel transport system substrate-binding protein [Celeribacter indicus]
MTLNRRRFLQTAGTLAGAAILARPERVLAGADATLTVALESVPNQLDPLRYQTNPGYRVMANMYDTLLRVDYAADGALRPGLAENWTRVDAQTIDLVLRQGVKFHDGNTMTAEDVIFSLSEVRLADPDSPGFGTAQQFLSTISGAAKIDDQTVRVTSSVPDPALEKRLSTWGSQIIPKAAFEAAGWDGFAQAPIGTGPFRFKALSPEAVTLVTHAEYWDGAPGAAGLVFRSVPELSSRIAGLQAGEFDVIADVPPDQFSAVAGSDDLSITGGPISSIRVVKFDTRNETLKDARVRRALGLAIDRQAIVDALWQGLVDVPNGHQLKSYGELYFADHPAYVYDPEQAKSLLREAGYDGTPIPYRIRTNAYGPELATAQILVSMWEAVGLKIDLQIKENFAQMLEFPGTGMRNGVDPVLVNEPLFGIWRSYNESEREVWSNEAFYEAGHIFESSMDLPTRQTALRKMLDIFDADPPAVILHNMGLFYGKRKALGWTPIPNVYMDFRGVVA